MVGGVGGVGPGNIGPIHRSQDKTETPLDKIKDEVAQALALLHATPPDTGEAFSTLVTACNALYSDQNISTQAKAAPIKNLTDAINNLATGQINVPQAREAAKMALKEIRNL